MDSMHNRDRIAQTSKHAVECRDEDPKCFSSDPDPARLKKKSDPDPTQIRNEKNKYLYILMKKKIFIV